MSVSKDASLVHRLLDIGALEVGIMRRSLLIASVTAATLAGGIAAAQQAPYQQPQTTRAPITNAAVAPRPVRLAPAAREATPAAELPGGPYAVMDEPAAQATAAYPAPVAAPARPTRAQRAAQEPGAPPARESGAREGGEARASQRAGAQAARTAEAMNGRMGRVLHDGMASLFETCPQMARATAIQTQKLANGISISYVSDDPVVVERLQKMADAVRLMGEASAE
jgi:hypothetical protein